MNSPEDPGNAPVQPESRRDDDQPVQWNISFLVPIIGIALIAIVFTAGFMELYTWLTEAIWYNDFVMSNRWT
ncbi:MAG: hypothetical protein LUO96_06685, partial [Methanomicrobiales archaeon]|nr:hypothetical protein [Methanomicrobiales archaeon]